MDFSIENISALEKCVKFTIPSEELQTKITSLVEEVRQSVHIPGFRKKIAPASIIKKRYGSKIHSNAVDDLIRQAVNRVFTTEKFNIITEPKIDIKSQDVDLKFNATFEIYPELNEIDSKLSLTQYKVKIGDEDITNEIKKLQQQHVTWEEINNKVQSGNKVVINFSGTVAGKQFQGGKAENFDVIVGDNKMIAGFEEALLNLHTGDTTVVNLTFPDPYPQNSKLRGKDVTFVISINKVYTNVTPPLNEDFFKKLSPNITSEVQLKSKLREAMEKNLEQLLADKKRQQIFEKLLMNNPVDVPSSMAEREAKRQRLDYLHNYGGKEIKEDSIPLDNFIKNAKKNVATSLLIRKLVEQHAIEANDKDIEKTIQEYLNQYNLDENWKNKILADEKQKQSFKDKIVENKILALITNNSEKLEQEATYNEFMSKL